MQPAWRQQRELPSFVARTRKRGDGRRVARRNVVKRIGHAGDDHMADEQHRQNESCAEANVFDDRKTPVLAQINRPQGENEMEARRAVERERAREAVPDGFGKGEAALRRVEAD